MAVVPPTETATARPGRRTVGSTVEYGYSHDGGVGESFILGGLLQGLCGKLKEFWVREWLPNWRLFWEDLHPVCPTGTEL